MGVGLNDPLGPFEPPKPMVHKRATNMIELAEVVSGMALEEHSDSEFALGPLGTSWLP